VFGLEAFLDLERERNNAYALRVGGAGQICFEPTCHSSIALSTQIFFTGGDTDGATVAAMGVGIAGRVSEWVSFLAEPTTLVFLGDDSGDEGGISWLSFGLRISRANFGLDVVGLYIFTGEDDRDPLRRLPTGPTRARQPPAPLSRVSAGDRALSLVRCACFSHRRSPARSLLPSGRDHSVKQIRSDALHPGRAGQPR
jgi:hypothetical protein